MAISPQQLTIYLYSAHRAVIFAIEQLSCSVVTAPSVNSFKNRLGNRCHSLGITISQELIDTIGKQNFQEPGEY